MAARRVGLYGHGDAFIKSTEASQNNTARGKAAAQEEGGLRRPAPGVQGRARKWLRGWLRGSGFGDADPIFHQLRPRVR